MGFRVFYGIFLSEIYDIEDCIFYDDNSKSYTATQGTFTYNSANDGYTFSYANAGVIASVPNLTVPKGVKIECDMKVTTNDGIGAIGISDGNQYFKLSQKKFDDIPPYQSVILSNDDNYRGLTPLANMNVTQSWDNNKYYHFILEVGDNMIGKAYDGDTLLQTLTVSNTYITGNNNSIFYYAYNGTRYYKNLKVKPL